MKLVSIVVPAFNVARTLPETLSALLAQTYPKFEVIIVDDGSSDDTLDCAQAFCLDKRIRVVQQANRGLAGARNTGISEAKGDYIGFCDADDCWEPGKLAAHVKHLNARSSVGVSYSGSRLMQDDGTLMKRAQRPRLMGVDAAHILKRNPIGNGSAPVMRRSVFDDIAYRPAHETDRDWYFDETFRQSEDVECWMRIALTTKWVFEGIEGLLTRYRINEGGLSAATENQRNSWERMVSKLTPIAPEVFAKHAHVARAYQLRYLCRRAVSDMDAKQAQKWARDWIAASKRPFVEEPMRSIETILAVAGLGLMGEKTVKGLAVTRLTRVG